MKSSFFRSDKELSLLYFRHVKTIFKVCFMFMKNIPDTEDMVQDTFIRLIKDNTNFQSEDHEKAWLIRTATNLCKDNFKRWWVRNTTNINNIEDEIAQLPFEIDTTLQMVLKLPAKCKIAMYMYYYEGYSTVEISKILEKKESTIRSQLHEGRRILKIEMDGDFV